MSEIIIDKSKEIQVLAANVDRLATELDNSLYQLFRATKHIKDYSNIGEIPEEFTIQFNRAVSLESELAQCTVEWLNARRRSS